MKILIARVTGAGGPEGFARLREAVPEVEFVVPKTPDEIGALIQDVDAAVGSTLTDDHIHQAKRLRWVHSSSLGVDWLTGVPALLNSDITVTNPRGAPSATMAEHAFGMILTLTRRLREAERKRLERIWQPPADDQVSALAGRTLGVVGLGAIGSAIAKRGHAFEMEVVAIDIARRSEPYIAAMWEPSHIQEFMRRSDVVAVAAPLTSATRGMIGDAELRLLRRDSIVVVVSRGGIVEEGALVAALKEHRIGGAGLDVFEKEPLPADHELWTCDNVILTPHCSGRSAHTDRLRSEILLENIRRFAAGQALLNVVDKRNVA